MIAVLVSTLLYRIPRGGPGSDVWRRWVGFSPGSQVSSVVWAAISSVLIVLTSSAPYWLIAPFFLAMWAGEKVPYMRFATGPTPNYFMASVCGVALLNPLLGPIYWLARKGEGRVPKFGPLIDGWTAYAELACGLVTAISYTVLARLIA